MSQVKKSQKKIKFSKLKLRSDGSSTRKQYSPHPKEKISTYFSKTSQENGSQTISESSQPSTSDVKEAFSEKSNEKLLSTESDDEHDFTSPKYRAFATLFQQKRGKPKNANKNKLTRKETQDDGGSTYVSASVENLHVALAMSKSIEDLENPGSSDLYESAFPSTQEKLCNIRQTLDQFGFKTNRSKIELSNVLSKYTQNTKKKFKYITPVLFLRTEEERKSKIEKKVNEILNSIALLNGNSEQTERQEIDPLENKPKSFLLRDCYDPKASLYKKDFLDITEMDDKIYYNKLVEPSNVKVGTLLRDWKKIPGREKTPPPEEQLFIEENEIYSPKNQEKCKTPELFSEPETSNKNTSSKLVSDEENVLDDRCETKSVSLLEISPGKKLQRNKPTEEENSPNLESLSLIDTISPKRKRNSQPRKNKYDFNTSGETENILDKPSTSRAFTNDIVHYEVYDEQHNLDDICVISSSDESVDISSNKIHCSPEIFSESFGEKYSFKSRNTSEKYETSYNQNAIDKQFSYSPIDGVSINNLSTPNKLKSPGCVSVKKNVFNSPTSVSFSPKTSFNKKNNLDDSPVISLNDSNDEKDELNGEEINKNMSTSSLNVSPRHIDVPSPKSNSFLQKTNDNSRAILFEDSDQENDSLPINKTLDLSKSMKDKSREISRNLFPEENDFSDELIDLTQSSHELDLSCEKEVNSNKEKLKKCDNNTNTVNKSDEENVCSVEKEINNRVDDLNQSLQNDEEELHNDEELENVKIKSSLDKKSIVDKNESCNESELFSSENYDGYSPELNYFDTSKNKKFYESLTGTLSEQEKRDSGDDNSTEETLDDLSENVNSVKSKNVSDQSNKSESELSSCAVTYKSPVLQKPQTYLSDFNSSDEFNNLVSKCSAVKSDGFRENECLENVNLPKIESVTTRENIENKTESAIEISDVEIIENKSQKSVTFERSLSDLVKLPSSENKLCLSQSSVDTCSDISDEELNYSSATPYKIKGTSYETLVEKYKSVNLDAEFEKNLRIQALISNFDHAPNLDCERCDLPDFDDAPADVSRYSAIKNLSTPVSNFKKMHSEPITPKRNKIFDSLQKNASLSNIDNINDECTDEEILQALNNNKNGEIITPRRQIIVKTRNITPMPNYSGMDSPIMNQELAKFGLKPMKRAKGVKILRYIYNATHPVSEKYCEKIIESRSDDDDENDCRVKRRKINDTTERRSEIVLMKRPKKRKEEIFTSGSIEILGNAIAESEPLENMIFERKQSCRIASCRLPLHIAWHNFVTGNPKVREKILLYEPLYVEQIYAKLKSYGFKYHIQDLVTFLDTKCITIRIAQTNGRRKGLQSPKFV